VLDRQSINLASFFRLTHHKQINFFRLVRAGCGNSEQTANIATKLSSEENPADRRAAAMASSGAEMATIEMPPTPNREDIVAT